MKSTPMGETMHRARTKAQNRARPAHFSDNATERRCITTSCVIMTSLIVITLLSLIVIIFTSSGQRATAKSAQCVIPKCITHLLPWLQAGVDGQDEHIIYQCTGGKQVNECALAGENKTNTAPDKACSYSMLVAITNSVYIMEMICSGATCWRNRLSGRQLLHTYIYIYIYTGPAQWSHDDNH